MGAKEQGFHVTDKLNRWDCWFAP